MSATQGAEYPPDAGGGVALKCEGLTKRFGGVSAVADVSLSVPDRGVYGLCGANGAGKSTLFNLMAGAISADEGQVWLAGAEVTGRSATDRARAGLARTWQSVQLLDNRTVLDNVALCCVDSFRRPLWRMVLHSDYTSSRRKAASLLERLGLTYLAAQTAGELTLEGQRMVEFARALARDPVVLLADEPASGLSSGQRGSLAEVISQIGLDRPVLMVEHDLSMLTSLSDRIFAMQEGSLVFEGDSTQFLESPAYRSLRGLALQEG
jgi:ABC-type branched-subunit amino acid transport system ATPase component